MDRAQSVEQKVDTKEEKIMEELKKHKISINNNLPIAYLCQDKQIGSAGKDGQNPGMNLVIYLPSSCIQKLLQPYGLCKNKEIGCSEAAAPLCNFPPSFATQIVKLYDVQIIYGRPMRQFSQETKPVSTNISKAQLHHSHHDNALESKLLTK